MTKGQDGAVRRRLGQDVAQPRQLRLADSPDLALWLVSPSGVEVPPLGHRVLRAISERIQWRAQFAGDLYGRPPPARLSGGHPGISDTRLLEVPPALRFALTQDRLDALEVRVSRHVERDER